VIDGLAWFGTADQLRHFLTTMRADRDEAGRFLIGGCDGLVVGLGGQDVVVPPTATYFVNGRAGSLALDLRGTSYGMAIVMI
jgi:hypothetical protein